MNVVFWILQIVLALHTAMGAAWKFSNSERAVPSLAAIPHGVWLGLAVVELALAVAFVIPALHRGLALLAVIAAIGVAAEMLAFGVVHLRSGDSGHGQLIYWAVVAVVCGFLAYGRLALHPL